MMFCPSVPGALLHSGIPTPHHSHELSAGAQLSTRHCFGSESTTRIDREYCRNGSPLTGLRFPHVTPPVTVASTWYRSDDDSAADRAHLMLTPTLSSCAGNGDLYVVPPATSIGALSCPSGWLPSAPRAARQYIENEQPL